MNSPGANSDPPFLTLVVTTYERPDALNAVLATIQRQTDPPDEVIIADDGSGAATQAVISRFRTHNNNAYDVHHVRQEHDGFRAARLRNLAIAASTSRYIVFIDGDMLLHPKFMADHRRLARPGYYTQGMRLKLDAAATQERLDANGLENIETFATTHRLGALRPTRLYARHNTALSHLTREAGNYVVSIKSCNQGFWRHDLVAVNGFNEEIIGWGPEDKELCLRLQNHGIQRQTLLFGGIAWHLHHAPQSRKRRAINENVLANTRANRMVRCEKGLADHT